MTPRNIQKGAITLNAKSATLPNLPQTINFNPVTPNITAPSAPNVNPPSITAPATGNGDDMYIKDGASNAALVGSLSNSGVGMIAQYSTSKSGAANGVMNVTVNNATTTDISTSGITFTGHKGSTHNGNSTYSTDLNTTGYAGLSAMKLVGGHRVNIGDTTINYTGNSSNMYRRWLFHTDGHNNFG